MTKHGSASPRKQKSRTLDANLKRRARNLATDSRVDARTRSLIRYGLAAETRRPPLCDHSLNRVPIVLPWTNFKDSRQLF